MRETNPRVSARLSVRVLLRSLRRHLRSPQASRDAAIWRVRRGSLRATSSVRPSRTTSLRAENRRVRSRARGSKSCSGAERAQFPAVFVWRCAGRDKPRSAVFCGRELVTTERFALAYGRYAQNLTTQTQSPPEFACDAVGIGTHLLSIPGAYGSPSDPTDLQQHAQRAGSSLVSRPAAGRALDEIRNHRLRRALPPRCLPAELPWSSSTGKHGSGLGSDHPHSRALVWHSSESRIQMASALVSEPLHGAGILAPGYATCAENPCICGA